MAMRFVTRPHVHVDRIATAWAIRRFIDPEATFEFVERTVDVSAMDAIPFDMRGADLSHHHGRCTFEALLEKYELRDAALQRMGAIIRRIDLPFDDDAGIRPHPAAAAFDSLRDAAISDAERLARGASICDALYRECEGAPG